MVRSPGGTIPGNPSAFAASPRCSHVLRVIGCEILDPARHTFSPDQQLSALANGVSKPHLDVPNTRTSHRLTLAQTEYSHVTQAHPEPFGPVRRVGRLCASSRGPATTACLCSTDSARQIGCESDISAFEHELMNANRPFRADHRSGERSARTSRLARPQCNGVTTADA
jgi:hypothetical protein